MDKIFRELIEKTKNIVATLVYKLISFFFYLKIKYLVIDLNIFLIKLSSINNLTAIFSHSQKLLFLSDDK